MLYREHESEEALCNRSALQPRVAVRVMSLAQGEREATAMLIAHLAELEARRLYLAEGCSSLFMYCREPPGTAGHGPAEEQAPGGGAPRTAAPPAAGLSLGPPTPNCAPDRGTSGNCNGTSVRTEFGVSHSGPAISSHNVAPGASARCHPAGTAALQGAVHGERGDGREAPACPGSPAPSDPGRGSGGDHRSGADGALGHSGQAEARRHGAPARGPQDEPSARGTSPPRSSARSGCATAGGAPT
jgi:hypothetical protein